MIKVLRCKLPSTNAVNHESNYNLTHFGKYHQVHISIIVMSFTLLYLFFQGQTFTSAIGTRSLCVPMPRHV